MNEQNTIMEDFNHPLQYDLSLKRLALVASIAYIYEDPVIKTKMKERILTKYKSRASFPYKTLKNEIIKLASEKVKALNLPKDLISDVQYMIIIFGKKIVSWADYIVRILQLDMSYLNEIYWTYFGTIDDAKIYDAYWREHGNFKKILKDDEKNYAFAAKMACIYGNEEAILMHQDAMIKDVQKFLKRVNLPNIKNKIDQVAVTYICFLYGEGYDLMKEKDVYRRFKQSGKVSLSEGIFICEDAKAVKFLWKYLKDTEKEKIIVQLARHNLYGGLFCSSINSFELGDGDETETEMMELAASAEIVLFLINQMSPQQKNAFLREHVSGVLQLFLQVWPYQEICLKLLDEEWISELLADDEDVLNTLLPCMAKDFADVAIIPDSILHKNVFHKLLRKIFSVASEGIKKQVLFDKQYYEIQGWDFPDAIRKFYERFDVNSLSIIINDRDLKRKRDLIISMGSAVLSRLVRKGELKLVLGFMEKVLIAKDERKKFIRYWDLNNHPVIANNPDFREKISSWLQA